MNKIRRIIALILTLVTVLPCVLFSLTACGEINCILHTDANLDGKCDNCGDGMVIPEEPEKTPCTHADANLDGKCDNCGDGMVIPDAPDKTPCTHADANLDGKCDNCGDGMVIPEAPEKTPCTHVDANLDGKCDNCGDGMVIPEAPDKPTTESFEARKTVSHSKGRTAYPAHKIGWSGEIYRGDYITYTITVKNNGETMLTASISDTVPEGTVYVSGCDGRRGDELSWALTLEPGEEKAVEYKVSVDAEAGAVIDGGGATVNGREISCEDVYVERTLNSVDAEYVALAIRILSRSSYKGLDLAGRIYTVAFTQSKLISNNFVGTPDEVLSGIASDDDAYAHLRAAVAPSMFGGSAVGDTLVGVKGKSAGKVTLSDLIIGDLIFIRAASKTELYILGGDGLVRITETAEAADTASVLSSVGSAEAYAVVRPSALMTSFTPSDPDEVPETLTAEQMAIVKTAEAYLLRGETLQYDDTAFQGGGEYRWQIDIKDPEDYTHTEWGYLNCAAFTYEVYRTGLGYTLPGNMYTTNNLTKNAASYGMSVFSFERQREDVYSPEEQLEIEKQFMQTLEPGDIMVRRHTNVTTGSTTGHAMLYVGCGKFIHSSGANFLYGTSKDTLKYGVEQYEPTIRCHRVHDYLFTGATSMFNDEYNIITIVRPLNKFSGEIPENTKQRIENLDGIMVEKTSSHSSSTTVNPGENITYTFTLFNLSHEERTIEIIDRVPAGCAFHSGDLTEADGKLSRTVTIGAGETVTVSYTVTVGADVAYGTMIGGEHATVGGVKVRCPAIEVKRTLTATEQEALLAAIEELKAEGTELVGIDLVNEIYRRATGVEGIFATSDTGAIFTGENGLLMSYKGKYRPTTSDTLYRRMLVSHLYGGWKIQSTGLFEGDRTRHVMAQNLVIGDVILGATSSSIGVLMYVGGDRYINLTNGFNTDSIDIITRGERFLGYARYFAVLRPSMIIE